MISVRHSKRYLLNVMKTCTDLTIPNVVNEIADISNWGELGIFLDLYGYDIERIRVDYMYDTRQYHQRLVENWFARDPQRSWEKLHRAMEDASARRGSASSAASSMASFHSLSPITPTSPIGKYSACDLIHCSHNRILPGHLIQT